MTTQPKTINALVDGKISFRSAKRLHDYLKKNAQSVKRVRINHITWYRVGDAIRHLEFNHLDQY